jgi:predicted PurR-regulated permease PerM
MKSILERVNQNLLFGVLLFVVLYFGKPILVPIMLGALMAMLMAPVCRSLDERGCNRATSTTICIVILIVAISGILAIIVAQITSFTEDLGHLRHQMKELLAEVQSFIEVKFNIAKEQQEKIAEEQVQTSDPNAPGLASQILSGALSTLVTIVMMLVYAFLFLYNKERFETFFVRLYMDHDTEKVKTIVGKIAQVGQRYLTGRAISVIILATLYSVALLLIGLKNAVLLAGIAALLTIIPYVGSTVGGMFPFVMALVSSPTVHPALMVAVAIIGIQTIDNYFIEPRVVGGEVNLSTLASIVSIVIGGAIWGVAGMILFIPMVGILKIVFDHVEPLKPLGYVIGDTNNGEKTSEKISRWIRARFGKKEVAEEENENAAQPQEAEKKS